MASTIPVVLDFLATLIGIGGKITEIIQKALKSVTQPIQDAIDSVLLAIKKAIGGFIDRLLGKGKPGEAPAEVAPGTPMTTEQIIAAVVPKLSEPTKSTDPAEALAEKKAQAEELKKTFQPSAPEGKTLHIEFKDSTGDDVAKDHEVDMVVGFSPGTPVQAALGGMACDEDAQFLRGPTRDGVKVKLTPAFVAKGGTAPSSDPIGWYPAAFALDNLNRGHVLGKQLGGRGTKSNLVAMPRSLNEKMIPFESKVAAAVGEGREVEYEVRVVRGSDVPFTHPMAVEAARSAGWPDSADVPDFSGVNRAEDQIAVQVVMSANVVKDCKASLGAVTLGGSSPLANGVDVAARRRAAVTVEFDFG